MKTAVALALMMALAASTAQAAANKPEAVSILPGGNSKAPISVEADKLDYFEKESKAIYTGNVVAIQGDTKLTCSMLTIYMEKGAGPGGAATPTPVPAADAKPRGPAASSGLRHMDCAGPVTMLSKTQTATGDNGAYDKPRNTVILSGHVTISDGRNVTKGDKLTYDLTTGQATMESGKVGSHERVSGQFLPGSVDGTTPAKPKTP